MWANFSALQTYYPLTGTSFWVDYQLWGFRPLPYHVENILLHVVAVLLFWHLLKRLKVPGAWLAAGVLALHPMMVESVAWITERKNVLSMVFFLGALLSYGRFARFWDEKGVAGDAGEEPVLHRWKFYFLAVVLFLSAYMAKATVYAFPAVLLLICWWKRGRLRWREDVLPTLPLFAMSFSLGMIIAWLEHHQVGASGPEWALSLADRFLIAGRAVWFYTGKLLWPAPVCFNYGRWQVDARSVAQWSWPIAALSALMVLWLQRHRLGRGPLAGCLCFIGTALPLLGFIDCYGMRYSFVWDHWVYIPSLGLVALFCAVLTTASVRFLTQTSRGILTCALLLAFGTLTWRQAGSYRNDEALWRDTVSKNPSAWLACNYLGYYAGRRGASAEALSYYRRSIGIHPNSEAYYSLANTLALEGRAEEAIPAYREALRLNPNLSSAYVDMGTVFASQGRLEDAVAEYRKAVELNPRRAHTRWCLAATLQRMGAIPEAIAHYREAVRIDPNMPQALENLATILASDPHSELRNGAEAVGLAERACQLTRYEEPHSVSTLG
jgi:tetratricopeptide (TPR) repeat protein